jgi:hypothetical protein
MLNKASGIASFMHSWTMHQSLDAWNTVPRGMRAPRAPLDGYRIGLRLFRSSGSATHACSNSRRFSTALGITIA